DCRWEGRPMKCSRCRHEGGAKVRATSPAIAQIFKLRVRMAFMTVVACCLSLCASAPYAEQVSSTVAVLVFTKTAGYRHEAIGAGIGAVKALGAAHHVAVEATEAAETFNDQSLAKYRAVIFLNTTGDVLDSTQRAALERFIRRGGGFVGIHSATDTEY